MLLMDPDLGLARRAQFEALPLKVFGERWRRLVHSMWTDSYLAGRWDEGLMGGWEIVYRGLIWLIVVDGGRLTVSVMDICYVIAGFMGLMMSVCCRLGIELDEEFQDYE